jgi:hypothetical protein
MINFIDPQDFEIDGKVYILSKFPAIAGREIVAKYPISSLPKLGEYAVNEETMIKLMAYVGVYTTPDRNPERILRLTSRALIDNHVSGWEILAKIEMAMLEYNCSFFQNGRVSNLLRDFAQKLPALISKILTDSLGQLSPREKPPTTN